tara:strand:+ start:13596 stop:14387 length:792 start_codon:yes stop_codon:yes gene_type:complete
MKHNITVNKITYHELGDVFHTIIKSQSWMDDVKPYDASFLCVTSSRLDEYSMQIVDVHSFVPVSMKDGQIDYPYKLGRGLQGSASRWCRIVKDSRYLIGVSSSDKLLTQVFHALNGKLKGVSENFTELFDDMLEDMHDMRVYELNQTIDELTAFTSDQKALIVTLRKELSNNYANQKELMSELNHLSKCESYNFHILSWDDMHKVRIIRDIRRTTGLGVRESKDKLELLGPDGLFEKNISKERASELTQIFEKHDCRVETISA